MTWSIISKTEDEKTRLQALALINDVNKYRTELVTNGIIVNDALRIVQSKMEHLNGEGREKRLLLDVKQDINSLPESDSETDSETDSDTETQETDSETDSDTETQETNDIAALESAASNEDKDKYVTNHHDHSIISKNKGKEGSVTNEEDSHFNFNDNTNREDRIKCNSHSIPANTGEEGNVPCF